MPHGMMRFILALLLALLSLNARAVEEVIYYHNDALGSPIVATDEQGRVVWRKSYAPYGQPIGPAAPNEPGYTGKFEEPDLGIQNFGARWYDPRIGRFLSIDPAGFDPQNPQSFNRYAYANNNPYKFVDPDGRAAETALDVISLGLSLNAFGNDPSLGNGLGLAYDALATAVPFLPAGFGILKNAGNAAEAADRTVIGKLKDIKADKLQPGEKTLLDSLPDQGNANANWKQNSSVLRQGSRKGQPIRDASVDSAGNLRDNTGFLRAERNLLGNQGRTYDPHTQSWIPPEGLKP